MFEKSLLSCNFRTKTERSAIIDRIEDVVRGNYIYHLTIEAMFAVPRERFAYQRMLDEVGKGRALDTMVDEATKYMAYLQVPGEFIEQSRLIASYIGDGTGAPILPGQAIDKDVLHPPLTMEDVSRVPQFFQHLWKQDGGILVYDNGALEPGRKFDAVDTRALSLYKRSRRKKAIPHDMSQILQYFLTGDELTAIIDAHTAPTRKITGYGLGYILAKRRKMKKWQPIGDVAILGRQFSQPFVYLFPHTVERGVTRTMTTMGFGNPGDQVRISIESSRSPVYQAVPEEYRRPAINVIEDAKGETQVVGDRHLHIVATARRYNYRKRRIANRVEEPLRFCVDPASFGFVSNKRRETTIDGTNATDISRVRREVFRMRERIEDLVTGNGDPSKE